MLYLSDPLSNGEVMLISPDRLSHGDVTLYSPVLSVMERSCSIYQLEKHERY